MKTSLLKKVCAIIIASALFAVAANAQIVYTNVKPDSTIFFSKGVFHLDLNNDGIIDYTLNFQYINGFCIKKKSKWGNLYSTSLSKHVLSDSLSYPKKLLANYVIDGSSRVWSTTGGKLRGRFWSCSGVADNIGNWKTTDDGYAGLQLNDGFNTYYGWVRLSVSGTNSITIKDYAYNSIPGQSILAGQTSSVVASIGALANQQRNNEKIIRNATQLKITPNPLSNTTTISFSLSQLSKVSIGIYDMTGRLVQTLTNTELQQGTHQLTWNAKDEKGNAVVAGIYFLKMQAGNYTETKKLVVVK
jgi:hypothetical protein